MLTPLMNTQTFRQDFYIIEQRVVHVKRKSNFSKFFILFLIMVLIVYIVFFNSALNK